MSSGNSGTLSHRLNTGGADDSHMDDDNDSQSEPMLWVELLSSTPVRKLMSYAQRNFSQRTWMDAQELAVAADVSENTIYRYIDDVCLLNVFEIDDSERTTLYRPNTESYVLAYLDDFEAIIRNNLSDGHE